MSDDEKAKLAREGLELIERAGSVTPEAIREKVTTAAEEAAKGVVLDGIAVLNRLSGGDARERTGPRPTAEAVERAHAMLDAQRDKEFDERLARAATRARQPSGAQGSPSAPPRHDAASELARLRRSFPPESRELATLLFACADLLEELASRPLPPSTELAKKEILLARIAELLAPRAGPALESFVDHVLSLSQSRREEP